MNKIASNLSFTEKLEIQNIFSSEASYKRQAATDKSGLITISNDSAVHYKLQLRRRRVHLLVEQRNFVDI
jgi:hypothetical protein